MTDFKKLNELVGEVNKMCTTIEEQTNAIKEQTELNKEKKYFMLCTGLAPYRELTRKLGDTIYVGTNVASCINNYDYSIIFFGSGVVRIGAGTKWVFEYLSWKKDFYEYHQIEDKEAVDMIAKDIDWQVFDENFRQEVERVLAEKAKKVNDERERAEKGLRETL